MGVSRTTLIASLGVAVLACAGTGQPTQESDAPAVRIGVYDSRSVAVAFAGSEAFSEWMADLKTKHDRAKTAGDQERVAELEAQGAARQQLMHKQAFSTAPVTNILEFIKDGLPAIREEAGVHVLVSKWDRAGLAKYEHAQTVDVTVPLIDALKPTERQRRSAIAIQKHDPIPLEKAEKIKH